MIKNLGQIAGLWVGNTSPQNNLLIWFDTGNNIHKTYDYSTGTWIPVSMNPIVNKTYAELQNLAALNSISQGTFYRITDLGYLALAITSTKIQYTDNNDNVIIDDLISTKTYCVTSSNLLIEDKGGIWDVSTNTLKFNFEDTNISSDPSATTADDYVLGTKLRSGTKKLSKYKLSSLISGVTGNAISWNKGFFLNFLTNLQSYYDVNGGVVRYTTYTAAINTINQSLNTLQQNINNLNIWNKTIPSPFNPPATPTDMVANDTLKTLLQKAQAWINKFKNAKGIVLSSDYAVDNSGAPAIGDTVEQAIGKIQYEAQGLPSNWNPSTVSTDPTVAAGDTFAQAFAKVQRWFNLFWHISTSRFWSRQTYDGSNPVFDFNSYNGNLNISNGSNKFTQIFSGTITQRKDVVHLLNFGQTYVIDVDNGNNFEYNIDSYSMTGGTGTIKLIVNNLYLPEPNVAEFLGENDQKVVTTKYALNAKSIANEIRASKYAFVNKSSDFSQSIPYEINEDTPEYLIIKTDENSGGWSQSIRLNIGKVRDGQIINIVFIDNGFIDNVVIKNSNNYNSAYATLNGTGNPNIQLTQNFSEAFTRVNWSVCQFICFSKYERDYAPSEIFGTYDYVLMRIR